LGYLVCNGHDSPERIEELLRIARGKKVREGIIACEFLLKRLRQIEEEKARKEREDKKAEDDSYRQMLDEAESSLGYDDLVGILQGLSRGSKSHIRIPANVVLMDYGKGSEECENYLKVMTRRSYGTLVIRIMRALAKNEKDHVKKEKLIAEIYEYCDAHEDDTDSKIRGVIELLKIGYDYQRHLDRLKALACLASCEEGKALVYGTLLEHKKADKDMVDDLEQLSLYGGPEARTLSLGFLVCNGYENDERVKELESIAEASEIFASKVDACEFLLKRLRQKEEEKTRKEREDKKAKDALSWQALEDAETDLGYDGLVGILHGFTKERERKYRALFAKAVLLDHEREGNETEENKKDLENAGFAIGYIHAPTFFGALARCERDIKKREILIRRIEYDSLGWKREKRTVGIIELFKCGYKPDTQIEKLLEIIDKNELCPTGEPLVYGTLLEAGKDDGTFVRKLEKISEREDPFLRANALGYLICNGHETPERTKELFNIARRPEGRASIAACEFLLKRIRKIQQKGLEKITPMAHRAGVTVAPPVSKYKLIVDQTLCKVEEAGQDKKGYVLPDGRHVGTGDRFEVEVLDTSKIGSIRNHIGSEEEAKNTIVQISGEVPEEDLKSLKSQGVRFIRIDTNDLKISGMNKDARRDARFDVYSVMLLARNITERDIREYSDTYRLLKFLVNTRFEDMAKTEEYISCLTKENLSAILSTNLPYRPAEKWDIEEYRLVISTLISA
ncbi:MAG: hypothetical protein KKG84_04350, partial [Candidatus Omnitrophica bacterium]|nr:hypothetical protein [Candidatus Omnitrophota bacterium]